MKKTKRWQFLLILSVTLLTVYHVLPTVLYYLKPLKKPVSEIEAQQIVSDLQKRVQTLDQDTKEWLFSFCKTLDIHPISILQEGQSWTLSFQSPLETKKFRKYLPRAGSSIPFSPSRLFLLGEEEHPTQVTVAKHFQAELSPEFFSYAKKGSSLYRKMILDRASQIVYTLAGPSESSAALSHLHPSLVDALVFQIHSILELEKRDSKLAHRLAASFTRGVSSNKQASVDACISLFEKTRDELKKTKGSQKKEEQILKAERYLKAHKALFSSSKEALTLEEIEKLLDTSDTLNLSLLNPFFSSLKIDWDKEKILLKLHPDLDPLQVRDAFMSECAKITLFSKEQIETEGDERSISFHKKPGLSALLVFDLEKLTKAQVQRTLQILNQKFFSSHPDLKDLYIVSSEEFSSLSKEEKALCLVIESQTNFPYVQAYTVGLSDVIQKHEAFPNSEETKLLRKELASLALLLQKEGFSPLGLGSKELFFQKREPFAPLLMATREEFLVGGTQKYALLELSNLEERIYTKNQIETKIHEELVKSWDDFHAAEVHLNPLAKLDAPKPTKGLFWNNFLLSCKKYFRGDSKKVIQWGLDLSGGKTVQIELRDANQNLVTEEDEIKQGISELYSRVNKMGVSEVAIRQLGNHIVLDFPGSQSLKAKDLIKASSMYFHIVNETFSCSTSSLYSSSQRFLQEVWNEALVTGQKDSASIHAIAYKRLYSSLPSEAAKTLLENGLKIASPEEKSSSSFDTSLSKVVLLRDEQMQEVPLVFVFSNYALEGAHLSSISPGYDPQKGNFLSFAVASSHQNRVGFNPRNELHSWTSHFAKDNILDAAQEVPTQGRGWRMAAILNDTVISMPSLEAAIREGGSISGSFSQNEIYRLAADLKAGSLSFTPHILSEKNVSPELGLKERTQGIFATLAALFLVLAAMILYYRFAGWIASIAVFFNLLILWAVLQNINATLSLAGIAGIILTVGMAVDANVLVFERIKEEFAKTNKLTSAIITGYKKAYSAILDSNITTMIAAFILLNFDAGPIKGFAITLIIGIASSMFTALFMTRFYFYHWMENPKHTVLRMANWIKESSIDFLKRANLSLCIALVIICFGSFCIYSHKNTLFGMDFTGGYSTEIELEKRELKDYRLLVENALCKQGISPQDFQVRELSPSNHLRVLFAPSMSQEGRPFFKMPLALEKIPQIAWMKASLEREGIFLSTQGEALAEKSWTAISGQMSKSMKNHAFLGLLISLICIFAYIAIRFESRFALASILCVIHDILVTLGLIGILHFFKVSIQIDLHTVAAIMTIVGYSLNDTIIIFDRIREELSLHPKDSLYTLINRSLNATLSRTSITSGTTLLVLIALVTFGGSSIFSFALVMTIGVVIGTLSSWFIASPLLLWLHKKNPKSEIYLNYSDK